MPKWSVDVKPVTEDDIILLERQFPEGLPDKHLGRRGRQQRGLVVYLIAWHEGQPVGHGLLKWGGSGDEHVASRLQGGCPDMEDLFVLEGMRSHGIGTQILQAAERLAAEHGYRRIGLSVDPAQNDPARRLYERLGYRDSGFGEYIEHGEYIDRQGQQQSWEEVCIYLIKELMKQLG